MKKSITTMTKEEWVTKYHGFIDENGDVKRFLMDYFAVACSSEPTIQIIGKWNNSLVAWVCGGYNDVDDCIVCVWWELDTNANPDISIETYVWDKERRASVTVA